MPRSLPRSRCLVVVDQVGATSDRTQGPVAFGAVQPDRAVRSPGVVEPAEPWARSSPAHSLE